MLFTHLFVSADARRPAKVSYCNIAQQDLLESLIDGIQNKTFFQADKTFFQAWAFPWQTPPYRDICEWPGVQCSSPGIVESIEWTRSTQLGGSIALLFLPPTIATFTSKGTNLHGTVHLRNLPEGMRKLDLSSNQLCGSLDFTNIPKNCLALYFQGNKFTGSMDLQHLPKSVVLLNLCYNGLSGEVDLRGMSMRTLHLMYNRFTSVRVGEKIDRNFMIDIRSNPVEQLYHPRGWVRPDSFSIGSDVRMVEVGGEA